MLTCQVLKTQSLDDLNFALSTFLTKIFSW